MGSRLFLIDGTGLVYRAFYAMKSDLKTSTGIPTNATYGVARMLTRFIKDWLREGDCVVFTMDKKTTTYRHRLLETYKANRPKTPDRMVEQLPYIKRLVEAMGIRIMEVEGHEADDLIATLTKKGKDVFDEIYIITGDKDMLQLVGDKIKVLRVGHRGLTELEPLDEDGVLKKFGVPPNRIVDFLALIGDKTDNVPGVKGIG
ncbi:MAG TPA: DNA polymerase I, partial [Thermotogales bacterium]|nr:DNA polymerase I [Thermotogales bacterium]